MDPGTRLDQGNFQLSQALLQKPAPQDLDRLAAARLCILPLFLPRVMQLLRA